MPGAAKLSALCLVIAGIGKLKLRLANRSRRHFHRVVRPVENERMHGVGAGNSQMHRNSSGHKNAVRDEQVLLGNHANRDRTIRVLLGPKIILDEFSRNMQRQRVDMAGPSQKPQQGKIDLVIPRGRNQAQKKRREQNRSQLSPVHRNARSFRSACSNVEERRFSAA